jgi:hypothetical protein
MPGVATAVELYGEGGSDKEERLELRAVIAAAGLGRCLGSLRLIFPGLRQSYERPAADSMNPRQAVVVKRANPSDEIGLRAGAGRP